MSSILVSDPIFGDTASETNSTFMADVVKLINESPSLVGEINALDSTADVSGGHAMINLTSNSGEGGDSYYHSDVINISALVSYDDATKPYAGGSFTAAYDALTPAAVYVGTLAHEIGHWLDVNLAPIYTQNLLPDYSIEQAVATELASEGKAAYSQYVSKVQIDNANGGAGTGLFHVANTLQQDDDELKLVSQINDVGQAQSYLGSNFWNVNVNDGTYLSNDWTSYSSGGAVNYLGIDYTTVTNSTVQLNDAGTLIGSTLQTASLDYSFSYSAVGAETASVMNSAGALLYKEVFMDSGAPVFSLARYQASGTFTQTAGSNETVVGNDNLVSNSGNSFAVLGDGNEVIGTTSSTNSLNGNDNVYFDHAAADNTVKLVMGGAGNEAVLGAATTTVSGNGTGSTVFGGTGGLTYEADGGTVVLGGAATVFGASANTVVLGGSGSLDYMGGSGYADVVGGAGSDTIQADAGGGWFQGGSNGGNLITGSNSSFGTVLAAGGNGDTINGGSHGGDYLLAGLGNETLNGGNKLGTQTMFLAGGATTVFTGSASSIIDTGSGSAYIDDLGRSVVYGGTGESDTYTAGAGQLDVAGFRVGTDHVSGSVASTTFSDGDTVLQMKDGASITLFGVQTHAYG